MNQTIVNKNQIAGVSALIVGIAFLIFKNTIGMSGSGYLATSFLLYMVMYCLLIRGVSATLGKTLRSRMNKGYMRDSRMIWRSTLALQAVLGLIGGLLLGIIGSRLFGGLYTMNHAQNLCYLMGPLFFFTSVNEAIEGRLRGFGFDRQSDISYLIRSVGVVVLGLVFGNVFRAQGARVSALLLSDDYASVYSCIGIIIAASVTEVCILLYNLFFLFRASSYFNPEGTEIYRSKETPVTSALLIESKRMISQSNAFLLCFAVLFIPGSVALGDMKQEILAAYLGRVISLPGIIATLFILSGQILVMPLIGRFSYYFSKEDYRRAAGLYQSGFHLECVIGCFGGSFLFASGSILSEAFGAEYHAGLAPFFRYFGVIVLLLSVAFFLLRILLVEGIWEWALAVTVISAAVSVVVSKMMLSKADSSPSSFAVGLLIGSALLVVGYVFLVYRFLNLNFDPIHSIGIPFAAAAIVGLLIHFAMLALSPHLGIVFTCILFCVVMFILYLIMLLFLRNITEYEIKVVPGGRLVEALGLMLRLL